MPNLVGTSLLEVWYKASTLTYSSTPAVDFQGDTYKTITLTGDATFSSSNLGAGRVIVVRIVGDSVSRNLAFPGGWVFIGAAAPASIAGNKTAVLSLTSFGTTDANVVAAYSVTP